MRKSLYVAAAIGLAACDGDDDDFAFQRIKPRYTERPPGVFPRYHRVG